MTAARQTATAQTPQVSALIAAGRARFDAITLQERSDAFPAPDPEASRYVHEQPRTHESNQTIGLAESIHALIASPQFWAAAALLPRNDLSVRQAGRPKTYPDWLLLLMECVAATTKGGSRKAAYTHFRHQPTWQTFAADVDQYVPDGMSRLADLTADGTTRPRRPLAVAQTAWQGTITPMRRRDKRAVSRTVSLPAPRVHKCAYFAKLWRGINPARQPGQPHEPLPEGHPWHGLPARVMAEFRRGAVAQYRAMGGFPNVDMRFQNVTRNQFFGWDGVVFPLSKTKTGTALGNYTTGGSTRPVYGTKFTIASARIDGQYHSRIILDLAHTGTDPLSLGRTEPAVVKTVSPIIADLARDPATGRTGAKGILVDSIVRGQDVVWLQRRGLIVVNYPHAESNPGGGPGKRLHPDRVEKNHLRTVVTHPDEHGDPCQHLIYATGGELAVLQTDSTGKSLLTRLDRHAYEKRGHTPNLREYVIASFTCDQTGLHVRDRIPLFHTDPTSRDLDAPWGEVSRVFPPSSPEFRYLYGARNDTESRHTDLKRRARYLPADVPGQQLRLLGAALTLNAIAWQVHLQAHQQPNVFDDTA